MGINESEFFNQTFYGDINVTAKVIVKRVMGVC